jgi:hypothetical protein
LLTINGDKALLQKQVNDLKEKSKDSEFTIRARLQEKDIQLRALSQKYDEDIDLLKDAIKDMQQLLKNPIRLFELAKSGGFDISAPPTS